MKPFSAARDSDRRSTCRGSAQLAEPSGSRMSQNILALSPDRPPSNGNTWNVAGSGIATMSDS